MRYKRSCITLILNLLIVFSLCSCGGKEKNANELGSTVFGHYSPELTEDKTVKVYARKDVAYFNERAVSLPVEGNYFAVFNDKLYYIDTEIGFETGEIAGGECKLLCCDLNGQAEESKTVFTWENIAAMGRLMIQEGILYTSWLTAEDKIESMVIDLETGEKIEISVPDDRDIVALTSEQYYFLEGQKIYCCGFGGENVSLFCETETAVCDVYIKGDFLYVITEGENGVSLEQFGKDGKQKQCYTDFEKVGAEFVGRLPRFVKAEGNTLFYELSGHRKDAEENTFLVQVNLETGEKEILGRWYMP